MRTWLLITCSCLTALLGCPPDVDESPGDDDSAVGDDDSAMPGDDDSAMPGDDDTADDDSADDDDDTAPTPPELTIACPDSLDDVYVTPAGLPPWDETVLGDVVRCAPDEVLSAADLLDQLLDVDVTDVIPIAGAAVYRIAYRTTRWEGQEGLGTARVFLPDTLAAGGPLPMVVVNHGTLGLADHCAASMYPTVSAEMSLAFAGGGFAVIAPDYAGLGTEGTQGYPDKADTAHSVLDAARALRSIVTPQSLAPGTIAVGHSQGGGASLSAHAYAGSYGDGDLLGVIPFAPGWQTSTENLWWVSHFPNLVPWSGSGAMVMTLALYADAANFVGPGHEVDYFDSSIAADVADLVENQCVIGLSLQLPLLAATAGAALDDGFIASVADCMDGLPACGPPGDGYVQRAEAGSVPLDPASGPILLVGGMLDTSSTPEELACIVDAAIEDGVEIQACTDAGAEHMDLTARQARFAVEWAVALARGSALPPCAESELPACE